VGPPGVFKQKIRGMQEQHMSFMHTLWDIMG